MPFSPNTPRPPSSSSSQWIFTKSEILASPSIREGLDSKTEKGNRSKGCQFIETVGQRLRLHQPTIATASMFFHRFYMRQSFSRFHQYDVAATCLFLATKVEENPRKLPDLITAATRFSQRNWELEIDEQSKEYWKWRDTILYTEEQLLEALCFDFDITHPYDYLLALVQRFAPGNSTLGKCAWAFINDSHRTMVQIMYPPNVIAAAAFYFARKFTHTEVPCSPDGKEWWEQYGVKIEALRDAVMMMVETYNTLPQLTYQGKYPQSVVSPPSSEKNSSRQNGSTSTDHTDVEMKDAGASQNTTEVENPSSTIGDKSPEIIESKAASPRSKQSSFPSPSRRRSSTSSARPDRESYRPPPPRDRDSYRPRSPDRHRSHSRGSRSRSRGRYQSRPGDRRVSPERRRSRDVYIPPHPKRSIDEDSSRGREKRRRDSTDGDISEGEIR